MLAQTFSRGKTRQDNSFVYNLYILCSVDDIGIVHHNALSIFNTTNDYLPPKVSLVGDPDMTPGLTLRLTRCDKLLPLPYQDIILEILGSCLRLPLPTDYCTNLDLFDPLDSGTCTIVSALYWTYASDGWPQTYAFCRKLLCYRWFLLTCNMD